MLQEIRQRAEQLPEQRVRSALRGEVEGYPRYLDREPDAIEVGGSEVQGELRTDVGTLLPVAEVVGTRCVRLLPHLGPSGARERPRHGQVACLRERQLGDREDPMQGPVT